MRQQLPEPESNPDLDTEPASSPDPLNDPTITFTAADFITAPGSAAPARARILPPPLTAAQNRAVGRAGNSTIRTARTAALGRTQRSDRFGSIGRHSSPRKQTFELEIGNNQSPQRLFVTVESSHDFGRPRGLEMGSSRRRLFPDTPAATTSRVPLKDEETAATPRGRGRPPKARSGGTPGRTPSTRLAARAATPAPAAASAAMTNRRSSLRLMQRVDDTDQNQVSVDERGNDHDEDEDSDGGTDGQGRHGGGNRHSVRNRQDRDAGPEGEHIVRRATGRASDSDESESDDGGETDDEEYEPPSSKSVPKSHTLKRKGGSPAKGSAPKKRRGQPPKARAPAVPEEAHDEEDEAHDGEEQAGDRDDAATAQDPSPGSIAGSYFPPAPESEQDIWMAAASEDRPEPVLPTAGLRPRVLSSSSSSLSELSDRDFDSGPDVAMAGATDDGNDDSDNEPAEHRAAPGANSRRDLDTIAQGEEFSMIFMDSNRPAVAPTAPEDLGEETSLIINNTLQSLRASRTEPPEPAHEPELTTRGPEREAGRPQQLMPPPPQPRPGSSRIGQTAANSTNVQTGSPLQWTPRKARSVALQIQSSMPPSGGQPSSKPLTPSDTPSPRATLPPLPSAQSTARPTLSPIVRAGRVLQSVTSDPPTPGMTHGLLGSPFRLAPGEKDPQADNMAAAAAIVARLRSRVPPPLVPAPPARPAHPRKVGRPSQQRPLPDEQGDQNSDEGEVVRPSRQRPPPNMQRDEENCCQATIRWPLPYEDGDEGEVVRPSPQRPVPKKQRHKKSGQGQDKDADTADNGGGDDDVWAVEASRPTPRTNRLVANQQPAPKQTPALTKTSTLAGFFSSPALLPGMLLSGVRNTLGLGAGLVNAKAYESETTGPSSSQQGGNTMFPSAAPKATSGQANDEPLPTVLQRVRAKKNGSMPSAAPATPAAPAAPAAPATRPAADAASITQQQQTASPVPGMVLPPVGLFPTPAKARSAAPQLSPAAVAAPAVPPAALPPVGLFPTPAKAKTRSGAKRRPAPAASTVPPDAALPTIRQNCSFDPRFGQSSWRDNSVQPSAASNPAGPLSDEQARLVTPPHMQLSRNDIRQWQEQTSAQQAIAVDENATEVDENETEVDQSETGVGQEAERENPTAAVAQNQEESAVDCEDNNEATSAPPAGTDWTRDDWIMLDKLLHMRRRGPLPDGFLGEPRPPHRLLGCTIRSGGDLIKTEQWHMDIACAFKHRMGESWETVELLKRVCALITADLRRGNEAAGRLQY